MKMRLVTCSYGPDFDRCAALCASAAAHMSTEIEHLLIVPKRDVKLFRTFQNYRTRVLSVEDVLPRWIWRVPIFKRWWVTPFSLPVRGWIIQQMTKLSVPLCDDAEVFVFADSDVRFIRPFGAAHIVKDARVRLHRLPGLGQGPRHRLWNRQAAEMLGIPPKEYFGNDYIGQLVSWRRDHSLALLARIEQVANRDWRKVLCRTLHFAEYVLYGVYVETMFSEGESGHWFDDHDLCHCSWHYCIETEADIIDFVAKLQPHHIAVLAQSYLQIPERVLQQAIAQTPLATL